MIDKLCLTFSLIFVFGGATFLYNSFFKLATNRTVQVLWAATLLALGLFIALRVVESWRRWRKLSKVRDTSQIEPFNSTMGVPKEDCAPSSVSSRGTNHRFSQPMTGARRP